MKVNQVPSTRNEEEDGTEVLRNKEEEQTKPAAKGTEIPYDVSPSQSSADTTLPNIKTILYQNHEIMINVKGKAIKADDLVLLPKSTKQIKIVHFNKRRRLLEFFFYHDLALFENCLFWVQQPPHFS